MVRVFCIIPLALAAVSAVSGHVIRRKHSPPSGWQKDILQNYDAYHGRYMDWGCENQHNTTFFEKCCHPLLKGESMSVLENLGCKAPDDECDDGNSSAPPSYTPSPAPQPAHANTTPSASPSPESKPISGALAKGDDTPSSPSPSPQPTTPSPPPKSSTSPAPAQTNGGGGGGGGGDVHTGGVATFFFQNGVAGACGTVHQDTDLICAMDSAIFNQNICGKSVQITNTQNGKTVTVVVADECPTCENANSIDLSHGAFGMIADFSQGEVPISWKFV